MTIGKTIALTRRTFVGKVMSLLLNMLSAAAAKSLQSCPTLCDPIDGGPPGSSVPGILQARTRWTFVGKVMSLLFNMLCRLVIAFLPRSKHLLGSVELTLLYSKWKTNEDLLYSTGISAQYYVVT